MKRIRVRHLLTMTLALLGVQQARAQGAQPAVDIEVRALRGVGAAGPGLLCVGSRNAIRVELAIRGQAPTRAVPLRLVLMLPGGDPSGVLVAEGSAAFPKGVTTVTFTFLNVEVPARFRGRGALLEVRANLERAILESDLTNNLRSLPLDTSTDWTCRW
jgi:hypothetical protein